MWRLLFNIFGEGSVRHQWDQKADGIVAQSRNCEPIEQNPARRTPRASESARGRVVG
jgi:hypothetical protein